MEEDNDRPRKLPKLDHDESQDSEPRMTGALQVADNVSTAATAGTDNGDNEQPTMTSENDTTTTTTTHGAAADSTAAPTTEDGTPKISKREMKRQRRREQWDQQRDLRLAKRKKTAQARKERRRAAFEQARLDGTEAELKKQYERTQERFRKSTLLPLTLVIDCGYDELMLEKERISLGSQITRSYSDNSRSVYRSHLVFSSFNKKLKERFDTKLNKHYLNWKGVRILPDDFAEVAEKAKEWMVVPDGGKMEGVFADKTEMKPEEGEVVYLSSDSPHTLTELKPFSTYIVGGLVDKNRHKGICYKQAVEKGIKTAKLPIGDYIQMASRQVLATNHVVEIMLKWLELGDWGKAFLAVIPQRKGGKLKESGAEAEGSQHEEDNAEEEEEEEALEQAQEVTDEAVEQAAEEPDQAMAEVPAEGK
ncbi:tRNA (guanine(9)-N(1))-methyltransferase [Aspergillus luchuensis]|uniref:tRNA (guanine(9)-N1)-methyltransferase n=1 Tax=Aspergillus kawachii TaxID=1069201 RepID=A0A146FED5_ASPKA|nr:tRNA (guanine(9)-N(1))-methyltransferase [Aspergillus luchuensis]BCS03301.1 tRNA (guanine(9)-N(1))-methyltransferase [Aspergillus luchuensis]BCS14930.1 tRNA (guanine(9)-N(1))-methyltransferase [Aspergillus luchuensis]GAA84832.1 tRNA m(1)G methyltransferase domain containing protein [Aspergillus luchuensis IFO 4308]GAT24564.1 tRNA m(1)G methyltransferase domain containing protein [Aspergillus luchuensis]